MLLATSSTAFGASASWQPSAASLPRQGIRAAIAPSLAGMMTRVGWARTKSMIAAEKPGASVAKLGSTTLRAQYRDRKASTGSAGSHSAKHSASATRSPARPRLRAEARLCLVPASRIRTS